MHTFMVSVSGPSNGNAKGTVADIRSALVGVNPEWAQRTTRTYNDGLLDWCRDHGFITLQELTLPVLTEYVGPMKCSPPTAARAFGFCAGSSATVRLLVGSQEPGHGTQPSQRQGAGREAEGAFRPEDTPEPGPEWQAI